VADLMTDLVKLSLQLLEMFFSGNSWYLARAFLGCQRSFPILSELFKLIDDGGRPDRNSTTPGFDVLLEAWLAPLWISMSHHFNDTV